MKDRGFVVHECSILGRKSCPVHCDVFLTHCSGVIFSNFFFLHPSSPQVLYAHRVRDHAAAGLRRWLEMSRMADVTSKGGCLDESLKDGRQEGTSRQASD